MRFQQRALRLATGQRACGADGIPTPVGNDAAVSPETNPLVLLDHTTTKSETLVSKAPTIGVEPALVTPRDGVVIRWVM